MSLELSQKPVQEQSQQLKIFNNLDYSNRFKEALNPHNDELEKILIDKSGGDSSNYTSPFLKTGHIDGFYNHDTNEIFTVAFHQEINTDLNKIINSTYFNPNNGINIDINEMNERYSNLYNLMESQSSEDLKNAVLPLIQEVLDYIAYVGESKSKVELISFNYPQFIQRFERSLMPEYHDFLSHVILDGLEGDQYQSKFLAPSHSTKKFIEERGIVGAIKAELGGQVNSIINAKLLIQSAGVEPLEQKIGVYQEIIRKSNEQAQNLMMDMSNEYYEKYQSENDKAMAMFSIEDADRAISLYFGELINLAKNRIEYYS